MKMIEPSTFTNGTRKNDLAITERAEDERMQTGIIS
jgi:hypothetical protein